MTQSGSPGNYCGAALERDVSVLLSGVLVAFVAKHVERVDEARSCGTGIDDIIDVATRGGDVGM